MAKRKSTFWNVGELKRIIIIQEHWQEMSDNGAWIGETDRDKEQLLRICGKSHLLINRGMNIDEVVEMRTKCEQQGVMLLKGHN